MDGYIGIAAALTAAGSWALASVLFKGLSEENGAVALTYAKAVVCSLILLGIVLLFRIDFPGPKEAALLVSSGIVGILIGDICFFKALRHLTPQALVVLLVCGQVLTAILALIVLGENVAAPVWGGLALVLLGLYFMMMPGPEEVANKSEEAMSSRHSSLSGLFWGALSILCMAVSMVIAKPALEANSTLCATLLRMTPAAVGLFFIGLLSQNLPEWHKPIVDRRYRKMFFLAALVITFGGFWMSMVAIKNAPVAVAGVLMSTEPLFVLPFVAIVQKKRIRLSEYGGAVLTTVGLILVTLFTQ